MSNTLSLLDRDSERRNWHKFVINHYKSSSSKVEKKVGKDLDSLRDNRNRVDYDDEASISSANAMLALMMAHGILQRLENPKISCQEPSDECGDSPAR